MFHGRYAVALGLTHSHVKRQGAEAEFVKIAGGGGRAGRMLSDEGENAGEGGTEKNCSVRRREKQLREVIKSDKTKEGKEKRGEYC